MITAAELQSKESYQKTAPQVIGCWTIKVFCFVCINQNKIKTIKVDPFKDKVVSVKKQEVDNIVEQFNIQVDNPVCFLNQETSKHFLNSSNKSDKYKVKFVSNSKVE